MTDIQPDHRCAFCGTYDAYRYKGKIDWQNAADGTVVCGADCKSKQDARSAEIARAMGEASGRESTMISNAREFAIAQRALVQSCGGTDAAPILRTVDRLASDLLVALDERDVARGASATQAAYLRQAYAKLAELERDAARLRAMLAEPSPDIGRLINAAASAGGRRVEAEEAVERLANPRTESARRALQSAHERLEQARQCRCPATPESVHVCDGRCA